MQSNFTADRSEPGLTRRRDAMVNLAKVRGVTRQLTGLPPLAKKAGFQVYLEARVVTRNQQK